ncbi:hypothetical protein [Flavobacterium sp. ZB4P13]|uniref:hypothetical protein n=1 Tax=Flavobacterium sp. ZB4P13 TaxID=3401728 RepID=UPI003AAEDAF5
MLKNILKLEGAQKLTKNEQKVIKGGVWYPAYCNPTVCADPNYLNDSFLRKCKAYCDAI